MSREKLLNLVTLWQKGKNPMLRVPSVMNDSIMEKIPANDVWGNPKPKEHWSDYMFK